MSLVKQVVPQSEDELYRILAFLQAKEFVYEQPAFPESDYLFKHALTQEVAYGTVLHEQRKTLHERTGQAIEALYRANVEDRYSELAHHYSHTDNAEKAVVYLGFAGQQAFQRSAYDEALRHLTSAIEVLRTLPDTSDRSQHELPLQITLGSVLQATKGFTNPEVEQAYTRARDLCEQVGEPTQLAPALYGLWQLCILRAEHQKARALGEQLFTLAQTAPDLALQSAAQRALGEPLLWLGEFSRARDHLEHGSSLYNPEQHRGQAFVHGLDPGVAIRTMAAHALERIHQAMTLAERGQFEAGIAQMRQGRAGWRATGAEGSDSYWLALLVEACRPAGQAEEGLALLAEAMEIVHRTGERFYEAELYRLKGALILQKFKAGPELSRMVQSSKPVLSEVEGFNGEEEAEEYFRQALDIARSQQAKSLELRAATSLARLWQKQSETAEACDLLAPVYNWFTEGFDTADLKDAKTLLADLS